MNNRFTDDNIMKKIVRENSIHKATSTRNYPDKDPIITNNPSLLLGPKEIKKDSSDARIREILAVYNSELPDLLSED